MDLIRRDEDLIAIHKGIVIACSFVIFLLSAYAMTAGLTGRNNIVGAVLVNSGFIFAQPITYLTLATLGLTYSGFELAKPHLLHFSPLKLSFVKLVAFIGLVLAAYEVFYNFAIWTAELSTNSLLGSLNPDILINSFPSPKTPWNLVFAMQLSLTIVVVGVYAFYIVGRTEREAHPNDSLD